MTADTGSQSGSTPFDRGIGEFHRLQNLIAGVIGTASLLYALGFVIVNIYLASKGVRDFEFNKPTYISAGSAFFLVTLFLVSLSAIAADFIITYRIETHGRALKVIGSIATWILTICGRDRFVSGVCDRYLVDRDGLSRPSQLRRLCHLCYPTDHGNNRLSSINIYRNNKEWN